jgi:hypothetical protein
MIHLKKTDYRAAIPELRTNVDRCAYNLANLAYGYALAGRREEALASLYDSNSVNANTSSQGRLQWSGSAWIKGLPSSVLATNLLPLHSVLSAML